MSDSSTNFEPQPALISDTDVAVIGGSIAGSFASFLLGSSGLRVTCFDAQNFPRRKPCGEGLAAAGLSYLMHYGLWNPDFGKNAQPLGGYKIKNQSGKTITLKLAKADSVGVARYLVDDCVREHAKSLLTVKMLPEYVSSVERVDERWLIKSEAGSLLAKYVVVATGAAAKNLSLPVTVSDEAPRRRVGFVCWLRGHWRTQVESFISITHRHEGEYFITPLDTGLTNVTLLASKEEALETEFITKKEFLARAYALLHEAGFDPAEVVYSAGCANVQAVRARSADPSLLLVGDAKERFDPIGGLGITHALCTAEHAAQAIVAAESGNARSLEKYQQTVWRDTLAIRLFGAVSYRTNVLRKGLLYSLCFSAPWLSVYVIRALKFFLPKPQYSMSYFLDRFEQRSTILKSETEIDGNSNSLSE